MVADADPGLEAPLERDRQLDPERRAHRRALLHDPARELDRLRHERELAERRAGERGRRVERDVADQLQPQLPADLRLDRALQAAGLEGLGDEAAALAHRAVGLADREARPLDVLDDARLDELGRRVRDAADHAARLDRARDDAVGIDALDDRPRVLAAERLEEPPGHAVLGREHGGVAVEQLAEPRARARGCCRP